MNKLLVSLTTLLILGSPSSAQNIAPAPDFRSGQSYGQPTQTFDDYEIPTQPAVAPPLLPMRPALLPANVTTNRAIIPNLLNTTNSYKSVGNQFAMPTTKPAAKPVLSWRAKAQKLRNSEKPPDLILSASYDEALAKISQAVLRSGMNIDTLNTRAGELVANTKEPYSAKILIVFTEMPPGSVTVRATTLNTSKQNTTALQCILSYLTSQGNNNATRLAAPIINRGSF